MILLDIGYGLFFLLMGEREKGGRGKGGRGKKRREKKEGKGRD